MQPDLDISIESINPQLSRRPDEHTREYLQRMKAIALPNLDDEFIVRFAFMHDWCRFVTEMDFGPTQLEEVRNLIATLSKMYGAHIQLKLLASMPFNLDSTPTEGA